MYNYSLKLTYQDKADDTIYRKELLEAFNLKEYTDEINRYIDELYNKVKDDFIYSYQENVSAIFIFTFMSIPFSKSVIN